MMPHIFRELPFAAMVAPCLHDIVGINEETVMRIQNLSSLLAIGVLACGSGQSSKTTTSPPPPAHAGSSEMCSMMPRPGTNIVATDTEDGIAIAFTTTGDVAELRTRIHRMAEMHEHMSGMHHDMHSGMSGGMGSGAMGGGGGGGMAGMGSGEPGMQMQMQMVPSRATVEDIAGGARLLLVPADPTQLSELRTHVREHAAMMQKGECPMKGAQPQPEDDHAGHHPGG